VCDPIYPQAPVTKTFFITNSEIKQNKKPIRIPYGFLLLGYSAPFPAILFGQIRQWA
jgi:hypothetical protein